MDWEESCRKGDSRWDLVEPARPFVVLSEGERLMIGVQTGSWFQVVRRIMTRWRGRRQVFGLELSSPALAAARGALWGRSNGGGWEFLR